MEPRLDAGAPDEGLYAGLSAAHTDPNLVAVVALY